MEKNIKKFQEYFRDSLVWLVPVSLIISTFLLLFFLISQEVANTKSVNSYIISEVNSLKSKIDDNGTKSELPTDLNERPTYSNEDSGVKNIRIQTQKLFRDDYWGFCFDLLNKALSSEPQSYEIENKIYLINYSTKEATENNKISEVFKLESENNSGKQIVIKDFDKYSNILITVDNKLVLFNDFSSASNPNKVQSIIDSINANKNIPQDLRGNIVNQLSNIK